MPAVPDRLPPPHAQVLVIGGGPGGSTAASALAREGLDVVLLEMAHFPRYHVGESLIPSVRHYLRFIGAEPKVLSHGFARKPGSAIKFNQFMQEGYTDFTALGEHNAVWNVKRSEFDHLLLQHAEDSGASVLQSCRVLAIAFEQDDASQANAPRSSNSSQDAPQRPTSATYLTASGVKGEIKFDFLVDASGRAGLMSTKYLKNRHYNASLKNVAVWGYWKGAGMYGRNTDRENAPFFEALSDESGWAWFIPLANGLTSVGVVMDQKQVGMRSRACSTATNSTQGSTSSPLLPRPRAGSLATPAFTASFTASSGLRPRAASSASTLLHRGVSPSPRPSIPSRTYSASTIGAGLILPTTHEFEREIDKGTDASASSFDVTQRIPGEFPLRPPISTSWTADRRAAYPSPPLTPLIPSFFPPPSTDNSPPTPTSPLHSNRPLMRLCSPSVTGEEIPLRRASALAERYLSFLDLAPGVVDLIGDGLLMKVGDDGDVVDVNDGSDDQVGGEENGGDIPAARTASDYSYSASKYAGVGYRIIGDAGAFIDPFFSSGVHLAMTGALSAAASICASVRGDCTEREAAEWCSRRIAVSYTRFLVVVLSAYKQIRSQSTKVLADIDDDNFDKAFTFLRPVIQGSGEMGAKVSEDEVQRALDFCVNLFNPTTPEQHVEVREKLSRFYVSIPASSTNTAATTPAAGNSPIIDATISNENVKVQNENEDLESPVTSWMDVRAPIVSPSSLARMFRTRLRRLSLSGSSEEGESVPSSPSSPSVASSVSWSSVSQTHLPSGGVESTLGPVTEEDMSHRPSYADPSRIGEAEMKMVLEKVNARRVIHVDHMEGLNSLEQEDVEGFVVRLVRGKLGLERAGR